MSAFRLVRHNLVPCAAVAAAFALSACAATSTGYQTSSYSAVGGPQAMPVAMPRTVKPSPAELEADGLPVQSAPLRRQLREDDDPTEPYSPNYGPIPYKPRNQPVEPPYPAPLPISAEAPAGEGRIIRSRSLSAVEAEIIMSQAIAAHERRNP